MKNATKRTRRKKVNLNKIREKFEEIENPKKKKEKTSLDKILPIQKKDTKPAKQESKSPKEVEQEESEFFDEEFFDEEYFEDEAIPNRLLRRRTVAPSLQARHIPLNLEADLAEVPTKKEEEPTSVNYGAFKIGYANQASYTGSNDSSPSYASKEADINRQNAQTDLTGKGLLDLNSPGADRSADLASQFKKEMGYSTTTNQQGKYEFNAGGKLEQDTGTPINQQKKKRDKFGFF